MTHRRLHLRLGAYQKKSEDGGGVIAMIDSLIPGLDRELTASETVEKLAQTEYGELIPL